MNLNIDTLEVFEPLLEPARFKAAYGGRGSGKSYFFASLMIEENIREKHDNVCLREFQKSLEYSVKKLLEETIVAMGANDYFVVQDRRILTKKGGVIIFEGMQSHNSGQSLKSLQGFTRAWVEEAQTLSQGSLDVLIPTLRAKGSQLWFSWNPNLATDPVDNFFRGAEPPPDSIIVQASYRDNKWLEPESLADAEYQLKRDPDKFAHVWLGEYARNSETRVFKNWRIEEFDTPDGSTFRLGADWGFAVDPSVLVRCYLDGRNLYIDHEAYMVGCEIDQLPDLFRRVPDSERWFITADSARPETISYMRNHGFPKINAAIKGPKSLEEGIEFLKTFDIIVHPRCQHTIDELTMYSYKEDPLTGMVMPILEDKHNHVIDALRYACEGVRRAKKPVAFKETDTIAGEAAWMA